jgi:hypothetical protein
MRGELIKGDGDDDDNSCILYAHILIYIYTYVYIYIYIYIYIRIDPYYIHNVNDFILQVYLYDSQLYPERLYVHTYIYLCLYPYRSILYMYYLNYLFYSFAFVIHSCIPNAQIEACLIKQRYVNTYVYIYVYACIYIHV